MSTRFIRFTPEQVSSEYRGTPPFNSPLSELGALNSVNILVGANNSRKSRLCRHLLSQTQFVAADRACNSTLHETKQILNKLAQIVQTGATHFQMNRVTSPVTPDVFDGSDRPSPELKYYAQYNANANSLILDRAFFDQAGARLTHAFAHDDINTLDSVWTICHQIRSQLGVFTAIADLQLRSNQFRDYYHMKFFSSPSELTIELSELLLSAMSKLETLTNSQFESFSPHFTYIPTLRGTVPLVIPNAPSIPIDDRVYHTTLERNYSLKPGKNLSIWTGNNLYEEIREHRNAPKEKRNQFEAFETFVSENFFMGKGVDLVAVSTPPFVQLWIEGGTERQFHHLGDGVQALLNLTFPLFMCADGEWLVIEEPEVHLHPGFQTLFINTLLHNEAIRKKQLTIFLTTHSNHLLDTSLLNDKVSIFTMAEDGDDQDSWSTITQVEGGSINILDRLGVANSSVFLAQCGIWVEGITDRLILGAYLAAYSKPDDVPSFTQDLHYSFLEYSGSNISHYLFGDHDQGVTEIRKIKASAIGNRLWVLADHDDMPSKQIRHKELEALSDPHFSYTTTVAREIENTVPWSIISQFLIDVIGIDSSIVRGKGISEKDYCKNRLGGFLIGHFATELESRKIAEENGTLTTDYKIKLAVYVDKLAQEGGFKLHDLKANEHAWRLASSLHTFLAQNCRV